jgi:hypothetical protein
MKTFQAKIKWSSPKIEVIVEIESLSVFTVLEKLKKENDFLPFEQITSISITPIEN